jgi:hypothetical protein
MSTYKKPPATGSFITTHLLGGEIAQKLSVLWKECELFLVTSSDTFQHRVDRIPGVLLLKEPVVAAAAAAAVLMLLLMLLVLVLLLGLVLLRMLLLLLLLLMLLVVMRWVVVVVAVRVGEGGRGANPVRRRGTVRRRRGQTRGYLN